MKVIESNEVKTVRFDTVEVGTVIKFENEVFMKISIVHVNFSDSYKNYRYNAVSFDRNRVFCFDNDELVSELKNAILTY